ncbi:MAG: hypothetical protein ACLQKH_18000 [Steroidobacteraceae bacterium]
MPVRRFTLDFDGCTFYCAAFDSEVAREQILAGAHVVPVSSPAPTAATAPPPPGPRRRGRPSFDQIICAADTQLGIDPRTPLATRVLQVLKHLAQSHGPAEIPSASAVEKYFRRKSRNYVGGSKIARNRRTKCSTRC